MFLNWVIIGSGRLLGKKAVNWFDAGLFLVVNDTWIKYQNKIKEIYLKCRLQNVSLFIQAKTC